MNTCYGYVRVSTIKQGEGVSLEAQREAISQFAARNDFEVVEWFEEKVTAAKSGRPRFNAMVSALRRGKVNGVIFHKIDRSARNFADWAKVGDLIDSGVQVRFAHEDMDLQSRGGRLTADIQAVIAADFIRNQREEVRKGMYGRVKQGLYPWGAPVGYLNNGGGKPKTPDPEKAPLIQLAFELYASGEYSYETLLTELRKRGLRGRKGAQLSMCGLETILSSPFYCGVIRMRRTGETYQGVHEPLVTVDVYERVQAIKQGRRGKITTKHNHLLRGLFMCGLCQNLMIPERQKGRVYYRCKKRECPTKTVREDALESAITAALRRMRLTHADVKRAKQEIAQWISERKTGVTTRAFAVEIAACEARLDSLTDALIDRLIDKDTFIARKGTLELEIAGIKQDQARSGDLQEKAARIGDVAELVKNLATAYIFAEPQQKRQIIRSVWSNPTVIRKNAYLKPSNWVEQVENIVTTLSGAPHRGVNRTEISDLIQDFKLNDVNKLLDR